MSIQHIDFDTLAGFDRHYKVIYHVDPRHEVSSFIFVHRKLNSLPSFGATRLWHYPSHRHALIDGFKLSTGMSYKLAMAGLPYGGAKGIIIADPSILRDQAKVEVLADYAQLVDSLGNQLVTGADVGISPDDLRILANQSTNMVGLKVDPVKFTALGVYIGMKTMLRHLYGSDAFLGRSVAIQGLGKTGQALLSLVYQEASRVYVADISNQVVEQLKSRYPKIIKMPPEEVHRAEVDIFAPCALSGTITENNVNDLRCQAVVGSANCQLADQHAGQLLHQRGIWYAPDYIVNAGGVIAVTAEYQNDNVSEQAVEAKVQEISQTLMGILQESQRQNSPVNLIADNKAQSMLNSLS